MASSITIIIQVYSHFGTLEYLVVFAEVGGDGRLVVTQLALYQHVLALLYVSRKRLFVDARQRHAAHLTHTVQLEVHL